MTLNEAETKAKLIEPKLKQAGWTEDNIGREYRIKNDRYYVKGEEYEIIEAKDKYADYVLKVNNVIIAVIEAKAEHKNAEEGLSQAKDYSQRLDVPIAFATNGHTILIYDRRIPKTEEIKEFLTPEELYKIYQEWKGLENKNLSPLEYPYYVSSGRKLRSYQETAVKRVIEAILKDQKRILLTMATGTGKTFTSFQIVWKLLKSNYFSRVLFLTDRVFLREQAYNDYEPFKQARFEIKNKNFNKNRQVYFATYQTLYSDDFYKTISEDFFDLIIIDECHRSRYGEWGEILEHFNTAYHLGMTATPKREDNIDVYDYFGEPVFEYSMAQAIEDGYLVPYKIYKVLTNIDKEGLKLSGGEEIIYDDEIQTNPEEFLKDYYKAEEFEREITLPERTEALCKKFLEIIEKTGDKYSKSIIFCVDTQHAEQVRDTLNRFTGKENYATKIVFEDKDDLTIFRDRERIYPLVATTVDLLSTGIDIPHLKNIVFMRPISSRVLFKQIIGRGSRLASDKGFFRIIDFTNATRLIDEWDTPRPPIITPEEPQEPFDKYFKGFVLDKESGEPIRLAKVKVKVGRWLSDTITDDYGKFEFQNLPSNKILKLTISADGYYTLNKKVSPNSEDLIFELKPIKRKPKKITIKGINVFIEEEILIELDGNYVTFAEYKKYAEEKIKEKVHTIEELKEIWLDDKKREKLLKKLREEHIEIDLIKEIEKMGDFDGFDIIAR
ncbi:EcoAI/FtnUII family type I restriction enzme subunit R, partial [Persephonella sp.]